MSTIVHCLGKFRTARLQSEAPHWQAPQIWPIASPNDKPGFLSGGSWWFNHCQGSNLLDPLRCLWCYDWKQTGFILDMFKVQKKICQNWGPSTARERFLVWCFNKARVFYPGKSAPKSYTKKKRRLANTPIQLAIGSHQPGTWIQYRPQRFHQQFVKESICLWGFGEVWGTFLGYVGKIIEKKHLPTKRYTPGSTNIAIAIHLNLMLFTKERWGFSMFYLSLPECTN